LRGLVKILVVGMADSIHLARWLSQFKNQGFQFRLVSSSPHRRIHPVIRSLLNESSEQYSIGWVSRLLSLPLWIADRFTSDFFRGLVIAAQAASFKPDVTHVLEFQNGGYSYLSGRRFSRALRSSKLLLTPYGSDIYWFQKYPTHLKRIRDLVGFAQALSAECRRDELLAQKYGFTGMFGPRIPAFGAMELDVSRSTNKARKVIAIKGYQNKWGQALNALSALERIVKDLGGYEIKVFSCNKATISAARELSKRHGLNITTFKKGTLTNQEVQAILSESVAMVALSTSDGISASMIEAMANGAVPIQSKTSCCDEWLDQGVGGFLVDYDDVDEVAARLKFVIENPEFRERAARHNFASLSSKLNPETAHANALQTYEMLRP